MIYKGYLISLDENSYGVMYDERGKLYGDRYPLSTPLKKVITECKYVIDMLKKLKKAGVTDEILNSTNHYIMVK